MDINSNDSYIEQNTKRNALDLLMQISFPYIFIVAIIGICGNFLTIIMLSKKSLTKNFNNCTLIALASTDLLFNFALVFRCINDITQSHSEQICRLLSFVSHLAEFLSACFTAQFTAQRFIAVRFPLSVFIEKKIHLIHYLIVSLFIILGTVYCISLVQNSLYDNCHEELDLKWFLSDALISFLIPFTIIIILNILIIYHLKKGFQNNQQYRFINRQEVIRLNFRKKGPSLYNLSPNTSSQPKIYNNINTSSSRASYVQNHANGDVILLNGRARSMDLIHRPSADRSQSQSYRVTRLLILVSTCFLLLNAPYHSCTIGLKMYMVKNPLLVNNLSELSHDSYENSHQHNQTLSNVISGSNDLTNQNEMMKKLKSMELFYIIIIITQHISYASYSINFFLYSFCGIKFRRELMRCISKPRRKKTLSRSITLQNTL